MAAITAWLCHRTGQPTGQPGIVAAVQTFGDFLFWHPHVHVIAAAGVFAAAGTILRVVQQQIPRSAPTPWGDVHG